MECWEWGEGEYGARWAFECVVFENRGVGELGVMMISCDGSSSVW